MKPIEVKMTVAEDNVEVAMTVEQNLEFKGNIVTYYTGSEAPSASLGEDGDIYVVIS